MEPFDKAIIVDLGAICALRFPGGLIVFISVFIWGLKDVSVANYGYADLCLYSGTKCEALLDYICCFGFSVCCVFLRERSHVVLGTGTLTVTFQGKTPSLRTAS